MFQTKFIGSNCEHSPGAGEAALDPVLIHKHRARLSPRESWLLPRSLLHCLFVITPHRNGKHLVVHADAMASGLNEVTNGSIPMRLQCVCHNTLRWLISFSLGAEAHCPMNLTCISRHLKASRGATRCAGGREVESAHRDDLSCENAPPP